MKCTYLRPMLVAPNLPETIAFYENVLGFTCLVYKEEWRWASLARDGIHIMLAGPNDHEPFDKPVFTGSIYLTTDDVNGWWEQLKDRARVCYPPEDFEYGMREFAIYDNNGYLLQFGQPAETNATT